MTSRLSSTLIAGAFGALGLVVWSGCGSDSDLRYYCDGAGCFECDAYGCSSVVPPTHAACTGNASCASGQVCTSSGCTTTCTDDASCAKGETCQGGYCNAPGTPPSTGKGCTTKADCGASETCTSGSCQACGGTAGACPCQTVADCGDGLACVGGSCTAASNACKFPSDCAAGKVCADGACLTSCETATCAAGFLCEKGACQPTSSTGGDGGTTPVICSDAAPCGTGYYCNQGSCAVDTRPPQTGRCTADAECGGSAETPKRCLDGFCKYSCTTDAYCRTVDSRIGYCGKDQVCRTAGEANPACTGPGQCPNGGSCINNQCR